MSSESFNLKTLGNAIASGARQSPSQKLKMRFLSSSWPDRNESINLV